MKRLGWSMLMVLTLMSVMPVVSLCLAVATAAWLGCQLDEGSVHSCKTGGFDFGEILYTGFVFGWLMLVTWPGLVLSMAIWPCLIARRARRIRFPCRR